MAPAFVEVKGKAPAFHIHYKYNTFKTEKTQLLVPFACIMCQLEAGF